MPPSEEEANDAIVWALAETASRLGYYALRKAYYEGEHRLTFATEKFRNTFGPLFAEMADNLCPAVVDAVCDRLEIETWDGRGSSVAEEIWDANEMEVVADEIHHEAAIAGDAYVIVWESDPGVPTIYPQDAELCAVRYDPDRPGTILYGAKVWCEEPVGRATNRFWRVNLYYPDVILKYRTKNAVGARPTKAAIFAPYADPESDNSPVVANPWGIVPLFHFPNRTARGRYGKSELDEALPIQDGLNKSVCDMLVSMEYQAFRQRWATGIEVDVDEDTGQPKETFTPGPGRLWSTAAPDAAFGEFGETDLTKFIAVSDSFRLAMARDTGTPLSYLFLEGGGGDTGEALKTKEARLVKKVKRRQRVFGGVWSQVVEFAAIIAGQTADVVPIWENPETRDELNEATVIEAKKRIGISARQALRELGYTDDEIEAMETEKAESAATFGAAALTAFDRDQPVTLAQGAAVNGAGVPA